MPGSDPGPPASFDEIIEGLNSNDPQERHRASEALLHGLESGELEISRDDVNKLFSDVHFWADKHEAFISSLSWIAMYCPAKIPRHKIHRVAAWFEHIQTGPNGDGTIDSEDTLILVLKDLADERGLVEIETAIPAIERYREHKAELIRRAATEIMADWGAKNMPDCAMV